MTSFAGGGGAGPIYKDGTAISEILNGESITVPTGEKWVIQYIASNYNSNQISLFVNDTAVQNVEVDKTVSEDLVLTGGDTLKVDNDLRTHLSGWKL